MITKKRQFYCYKFNTDRLKKFNYDIEIDFNSAKSNGEIIAIADNQILRTIRDIKKIKFDKQMVEDLYSQRNFLKSLPDSKDNVKKIKKIQTQINHLLFFPEYVTIKIDKLSHYDYIFKNGLKINGEKYWRLSCSAGQARTSTVVLCCESIIEEVKEKLNNGRDLNKPIAPSKFNAYFGLYSSATQVVTEPKFVVVPDYNNEVEFKVNYVTETDYDKDDIITLKDFKTKITRTDGMGLISPRLAKQWASDLGLDYTPSQFIIRQSFLKGLVTVFDFHKFCEVKNNENYEIESIYKDKNGNRIKADLRNYDLIISESQFKLWDSYENVEKYIENCHNNNILWGVANYSPEYYDDYVFLNYQFIQSLNLDKDEIKELCSIFKDWISSVGYNNIYYTLLFLVGQHCTETRLKEYLKSWDIYWIRALLSNPNVYKDKYIQEKIYSYLTGIIKRACLGAIPVRGNFQYMVTDPYAYMQFVCGQEPTGLLQEGEFYSNYWNKLGITKVDSMRAPLTHFSEHTPLTLIKNEETEEWYKWCDNGIIVNWHGYEVFRWSGADFDGDIICTTDNPIMLRGIIKGEYPVTKEDKKPKKIIPTEEDLFKFDKFSMGSIIGQITNKGAAAYALLPLLKQKYGQESYEYELTLSRLKQGCKAQSLQIDKAKIGEQVKGIPDCWITQKEGQNPDLLLNKRPYFFKYLYKDSKREYNEYVKQQDFLCQTQFHKSLEELLVAEEVTEEEEWFLKKYQKWCPLIDSPSCMNILCHYIESIDFELKEKIKSSSDFLFYENYKNKGVYYSEKQKSLVLMALKEFNLLKAKEKLNLIENQEFNREDFIEPVKTHTLEQICNQYVSNTDIIVNVLLDYFYYENPKSNKDILWASFGKKICENLKENSPSKILFPLEDVNGELEYLGKKYKVREVDIIE